MSYRKSFDRIGCLVLFLIEGTFAIHAQSSRLPAEWEKQDHVFLSFFGATRRDTVTYRMIEALQPHVDLTIHVWHDSIITDVKKQMATYRIDTSDISFLTDPDAIYWTRDLAFFVKEDEKIKVVDFGWTDYGVFPDIIPGPLPVETIKTGDYDLRMASNLNLPVIKSDFVFEGGGIETNGNGTFLIIKEMAIQRNPSHSLEEIERELTRTLGAKKIIWLKDGLAEDRQFKNFGPFYKNYFGGGANMHVDELCRFVNETTVLLPFIDEKEKNNTPIDSINYEMLEANFRILSAATTHDGKKLKIVRIPMPEINQLMFAIPIDSNNYEQYREHGFHIGQVIYRIPAASYCNYFICNDVVLVQKYWKQGMTDSQRRKDAEAVAIIRELFPLKEIIPIFTQSINRGGGGIHCATREIPATNK